MSDEELEYVFDVAEALGCSHTTLELTEDARQLTRIGELAEKRQIDAAYHTHLQGNMANVDLGHCVAAGGNPVKFLSKFHSRISSFHMKDRTPPAHG